METKPTKLIVDLDPQEFGIESTKALEIQSLFSPVLDTLVELEKDYNQIIVKPIEKDVCIEAKELLKKYVKVRTTTAKIHKEIKADILKKGRFIDGWKNTQIIATEKIEENLKNLSEHFENIEREKALKIQTERSNELLKYEITQIPHDLGNMDEMIWDNLLKGVKQSYEDKKKAEEERRLEGEALRKAEEEKAEIQRKENEKIRAEAEAERKKLEAEKQKLEAEKQKLEAENKKAREEAEAQRIKLEAENKKIKADAEAESLRFETENKIIKTHIETLPTNIGKIDFDDFPKHSSIEPQDPRFGQEVSYSGVFTELSSNTDGYKIEALINLLTEAKTKFEFSEEQNKKLYIGVGIMADKIINYINEKKK